tara:strand:+ start:57 stop:1475 length:1419 start_codon:yes stop_codon:yes gene_type:complete
MAITVINPSVTKILLDLGIDPINPYDPDNAEDTYMSAVREGINTIESATKGKGDRRTRILREEFQGLLERKRGKKVKFVSKLLAKKSIIPTNRIRPQALLPPAEGIGGASADSQNNIIGGLLGSILKILQKDSNLDKLELRERRKERQREKRREAEERIEKIFKGTGAAARAGQKVVDKLTSPFQSIWKRLTEFLKLTVIGTLFNKALNWFSKEENQEKMGRVVRFLKFWWPSILAGYLAFFTPLGGLVTGAIGLLGTALPALSGLIAANPILAAAVAAGGLVLGAKALDGDFSGKEMSEEEKAAAKEKSEEVMADDFLPNLFNQGGFVSPRVFGEADKDTVPAMLTPGEFVLTKGAVRRFGTGMLESMNRVGGGTNKGGPMYEGGGLVGDLSSMKENTQTKFLPVKASGMNPVSTPIRVKNISTTTVLPAIKKEESEPTIERGDTIPTFEILSPSEARYTTLITLGIEGVA